MIDCTPLEVVTLLDRQCPDCSQKHFRAGPRGGKAQNIECRGCGARFNVTLFQGELVWAQRIESRAKGGSNWDGMYESDWPA